MVKRFFRERVLARGLQLVSLFGLVVTPSAALAYDWSVEAHVTVIETTYVGSTHLQFQIDQAGSTSCPAGAWIIWNTQGSDEPSQLANVQAQLSVLLSAKLSGRTIRVYGNNSDCSASFLWFDG